MSRARLVAAALGCLAAATAAGQGGPTVNESTGDLGYTYSFQLPKARGRYQPTLMLVYSSAQNRDGGFGHGWSLPGAYVERDVRAPSAKQTLWLVRGTERKLLVLFGATYRQEVEESFFEVTPVATPSGTTFTAKDAVGTSYVFDRLLGSRAWLTHVTDLDGNVTEYAYQSDKPEPTAIRYNLAPASTFFANEVTLEYRGDLLATDGTAVKPQPAGVDGGAYVSHGTHLWRVRIDGPTAIGSRTTIRGYELAYSPSSVSGATSIAKVTEYGGNFAASLPPTQFTYQIAAGYSLDAAVAIPPTVNFPWPLPAYVGPSVALQDMDGDGRPDMANREAVTTSTWRYRWLRNITPVGGSPPIFENTIREVALPANGSLMDFDGDGVLDIVIAWLDGTQHKHSVYRGRMVAGGPVWDTPPIVLDVTDVTWKLQGTWASLQNDRSVLVDLNGDGVLDYARATSANCGSDYNATFADCTWEYGYTVLDANGSGYVAKQTGTLPLVPGGSWYNLTPVPLTGPKPGDAYPALDINGDGLPDAVWNPGSAYSDQFRNHADYRTSTGDWRVALNGGGGALAGERGKVWSTALAGYSDSPNITLTSETWPAICSLFTAEDPRYVTGTLLDFDGDGRPDFYKGDPITGNTITWNTGFAFAGSTAVTSGPAWAQVVSGPYPPEIDWNTSSSCSTIDAIFDCCMATLPAPTDSSQFMDLNGDGIPDLVIFRWTPTPATILMARGVLSSSDASLGPLPVARPILLRRVQVPDGAIFDVDFLPSTTFGGPRKSLRPVVTRLAVSGPFVQPNSTYYWYAGPASAPAWYDGIKQDDRGFAESWSQDDVTRIVRHTRWKTGSHALIGRPEMVETGITSGSALGTPASTGSPGVVPSVVSWFARQSYGYGVRNLGAGSGAACASFTAPAEEPAASTYPLRVIPTSASQSTFHGALEANVTTAVACGDVDGYGNVVKTTVTPSLGGVTGKAVVTTQTFVGALSQCKNAFGTIQVARWDGANKVSEETRLFDASCRVTEQYATSSGASPKTNRTTFTYSGPFGLMDTSTTGLVTKRLGYDAFALNVAEERSDDGLTALSTMYTYDSATGLRLSFSGPTAVKKAGTAFSGQTGITRYYFYDAFGRTVAVAKSPFTQGTTCPAGATPCASSVNGAVEAYEYRDTVTPRAVVSYRYSVGKTYLSSGALPSADDASKSIAYRDGLGRVIQVRERLGGGGPAEAGARVTQTLAGYKVAKAAFLDGAGRESVGLEPFFDPGEAFVDYRAVAIPSTRGTVTTFDAQGRPWCTSHQYVAGVLPGPASSCYSDSSASSSYRLATETRYGSRLISARGPYAGNFVAVEVYAPDQNVPGGAMMPMVKLLGPAGEELGALSGEENRTWVERDALGREIASWRESGPRAPQVLSTPNPASVIRYNLAGQVVENWDANSTRVTRKSAYDEAGHLVYVTTDPATGEGIEYVYAQGDLGRVTQVNEVSYPTVVSAATRKLVARNHYDFPYDAADPGYSFVAGKLAWVENAETSVLYGYDDAGRVSRRDQVFTRLDATKRFTVSSTYGTDGRVLESRVVSPYDASRAFRYEVNYDSAGRPIALAGNYRSTPGDADLTAKVTVYEVAPSQGPSNQYGGYDPLGRVPVMRADDGRVVSARRYGGYSGALEGECKRFGDAVACGTVVGSVFGAAPALDPAKDIYRSDPVVATYRGAKLASYEDSGAATRYTHTYLADGRLSTSRAEPTGAVGALTQDWLETFLFSGIGNVSQVDAQRNTSAGNARPDRYETERYTPESPAAGQALDRVAAVVSRLSATSGGAAITGPAAATAGSTSYAYDLLGHLTQVTRTAGESETLVYAPGGELLWRQVGERYTFYMGEYATVTASGAAGCGAACAPQAATVEVDNHVVFAGTRIASVKPSRALYYYRTRLGTVVATSYRDAGGGSYFGAGYRYGPYGELELSVNESDVTRSELGYTNAVRLTGSLLHLKNRVYDAEARVFIQADVVDRLRYAYVMGDPVNFNDPTGLEAELSVPLPQGPLAMAALGRAQADQQRRIDSAEQAKKDATPQGQTNAESAAQKENGIAGQNEGALDKITSAATAATQKLAGYSVNENNNAALRLGAAVLGSITGLADQQTIGKTALTLGLGALALAAVPVAVAALTPEAATATGTVVAGATARVVGLALRKVV